MARRRARPVRAERTVVKRDCETGQFLPQSARDNHCGAPRAAPPPRQDEFHPRPTDRDDKVCYTTRGIDAELEGGELDAVNEKYELRGRRRVTTMREAIRVAMDGEKCLDKLDLEVLNETQVCDGGCVLPDAAAVAIAEASYLRGAEEAAGEREPGSDDDEGAPF